MKVASRFNIAVVICLAIASTSSPSSSSSSPVQVIDYYGDNQRGVADGRPALGYDKVRFAVDKATAESYRRFMKDLRNHLWSGQSAHGVPALTGEHLPMNRRYLLVQLSSWGQQNITLAIDLVNMYLVGYLAGENRAFFFNDTPEEGMMYLFPSATQTVLPFSGSYGDLESQAGTNRADIMLGMGDLTQAVQELYYSNSYRTQARYLIVTIQMISEAARFLAIQDMMLSSFTGQPSFLPNSFMLDLETSWRQLSTAVQESNGGVFARTFDIGRRLFDNVRQVLPILSLLLVCRENEYVAFGLPSVRRLEIRSVVEDDGEDIQCAVPEPTVRITGRDGLCMDVRNADYTDGTPIILWPCKSNMDVNQFWTFKTDGRIQSNGKCMSVNRYTMDLRIYDCDGAATWDVKDDGTILDRKSGLSVTAQSGSSDTVLTLITDTSDSRQCWLATNMTKPLVASIVGLQDLCMQANGGSSSMWLEKCDTNKEEQKWAIYGDGTVRPNQNKDNCLSPVKDSSSDYFVISIVSCNAGWSCDHRWMFTNQGTILNPSSKKLMDVRESDPSLHQIILWVPNGDPNQSWRHSI